MQTTRIEYVDNKSARRLYEIDYLRASAIIFVILFHTFRIFDLPAYHSQGNDECFLYGFKWLLDHCIAYFRMPLLIFVSGFMFAFLKIEKGKYKDTSKLVRLKFKRLLLPYIVFAPITYLCYSLWKYDSSRSILFPVGHLWFIVMLFWCFTITQFLASKMNLKSYKVVVTLIVLMSIFYPVSSRIPNYLGIASCLKWLWCFLLGYGCYSLPYSKHLRCLTLSKISIMGIMCIIAIIGINYIRIYDSRIEKILTPAVMVVCVLTIVGGVFRVKIKKPSPIFANIIKCSYGMYVVHMWILSIIFYNAENIFRYMSINGIILGIILFIVVLLLSYYVSYLILRTRLGRYLIG